MVDASAVIDCPATSSSCPHSHYKSSSTQLLILFSSAFPTTSLYCVYVFSIVTIIWHHEFFQTMITIAFMGSGKGLDTYNKTCHATVSEIETRPLTCVMIAFLTISIMAVRTLRSHFHRAHFQRCNVDTLVRQPTHLCCHGQERQYCRTIPVGYRRPGYELTAHRARAV